MEFSYAVPVVQMCTAITIPPMAKEYALNLLFLTYNLSIYSCTIYYLVLGHFLGSNKEGHSSVYSLRGKINLFTKYHL